jgi:hypothetical protein
VKGARSRSAREPGGIKPISVYAFHTFLWKGHELVKKVRDNPSAPPSLR